MKKYKKTLLILFIIVSLNGYKIENSGENESNLTKSNTKNGSSFFQESNSSKSFFKELGVHKEDEKIIIDLNKTKTFLKQFTKKMKEESLQIKEKVLELEKKAIEKIDKSKIVIDLNKTKNILEDIAKSFEEIIKESSKELNK